MAAPAAAAVAAQAFFPISELSTYHSGWTIRARVTAKNPMRAFSRAGGSGGGGQVFDVYLLDQSGSEIRANFFSPAAEQFHGKLEAGKCYTFSRGNLRIANRQYNRCSHRYELVFDRDSAIAEAPDDASIDTVKFSFTDLRTVQAKPLPATFDLCGVIVTFRPTLSFTSKDGKDLVKRDITIADDTANSMSVTLWGDRAMQADKTFENHALACLKGVMVKEYQGGRSGSLMESGVAVFQPNTPEAQQGQKHPDAQRVQQWWSKEGASSSLTSISLAQDGLVDLRTLMSRPLPCTVELVGIIVSFRPSFSFTSKDGKELVKREVMVADDSATSMSVTLWGERAKQEDRAFEGQPLVWLKGVVVKEWNGGRSGSLLEGGALRFQPAIPEAQTVQAWWSQGGSSMSLTCLSQEGGGGGGGGRAASGKAATVAEMREASDLVTAQGDVFSVICRLALVQTRKQGEVQPLYYIACQEPKPGSTLPCNKRVDQSGHCAACNRVGKAAPRLNLRCRFSDYTDSVWLTTFHEAAQRVLATTAEEAKALESESGREALEAAIRGHYLQQPLQVTVRAKLDSYNGEMRPNITCSDARPVQRGVHGRAMLKDIKDMLAQPLDSAVAEGV